MNKEEERDLNLKLIVSELCSTESVYIAELGKLIENFVEPGRELVCGPLCLNIDFILNVHRKVLLPEFEKLLLRKRYTKLGTVFLRFEECFNLYKDYCSHFLTTEKIDELAAKHPGFKQLVEDLTDSPDLKTHHIADYLIKPIQRLGKYELFLKDMMRVLDRGHEDYDSLISAYDTIKSRITLVNRVRAWSMKQLETKKVEQYLGLGWDPKRHLVRKDSVRWKKHKATCYVFSVEIVINFNRGSFRSKQSIIPLMNCSFSQEKDIVIITSLRRRETIRFESPEIAADWQRVCEEQIQRPLQSCPTIHKQKEFAPVIRKNSKSFTVTLHQSMNLSRTRLRNHRRPKSLSQVDEEDRIGEWTGIFDAAKRQPVREDNGMVRLPAVRLPKHVNDQIHTHDVQLELKEPGPRQPRARIERSCVSSKDLRPQIRPKSPLTRERTKSVRFDF